LRKSDRRDQGKSYPAVNLTTHGWRIGGTIDVHPDDTPTARITDLVLETAEQIAAAGAPYFLRVSFHAPHVPIEVPPSFMIDPASVTLPLPTKEELDSKPRFEREQLRVYAGTLDLSTEQIQIARGTYYGMVALADYEMGRIFERMRARGLLDNTIVAVNSDQGLQMGEHGLHKKRNFYEQTINAPLLISWPGHVPEGKVIGAPVEMVDFLPTLLDLSGMPVPEGIAGWSLVPLIEGKTDVGRKAVFAEIDHSGSMYDELRQGSGRRVMVRTDEWKLDYFKDPRVADKDGALYDLTNDPAERFNLYRDPARAGIIEELEALVDAWDRTTA
jgi:arylsulfatase A-like enzyme